MNEQVTDEERDELMDEFQQLVQEIGSHSDRVKQSVTEGDVTVEVLANEMSDTVLSLMTDLAERTFAALAETRDYVNTELAPAVFEMLDAQEDEDDPTDSVLLPEDGQELGELLMIAREAVATGIESVPEDGRPVVEHLLSRFDKALARVKDITLDDDDEGEDEDEDEDEAQTDATAEADTEPPEAKPNGASGEA